MKKTKHLYLITNRYEEDEPFSYISDNNDYLEDYETYEPLTYENATIDLLANYIDSDLENWNYHSRIGVFHAVSYDVSQNVDDETYKRILWQWVNEDSWYGN